MKKICDGVFEGGGMRGIGHVGAVHELEQNGYQFRNVVGSSAGAIVASLLAAGYTAEELHTIMADVNFEKFRATNQLHRLGRVGRIISTTWNLGIYSADLFEDWLAELLEKKNVRTFADVGGRLRLTASDITRSRVLVLPDDLHKFGIDPNKFNVATAVRMSMSIPIFFEPYELRDQDGNVHLVVDGGILSNYPIWIVDDGQTELDYPIFGFRFARTRPNATRTRPDFMTFMKQLVRTVIDDEDAFLALIRGDTDRTIFIPVDVGDRMINSTDFDMTPAQINAMFKNGKDSAAAFLKSWDFGAWKNQNRNNSLT